MINKAYMACVDIYALEIYDLLACVDIYALQMYYFLACVDIYALEIYNVLACVDIYAKKFFKHEAIFEEFSILNHMKTIHIIYKH